jgi:hypothetical protein
VDNTWSCLILLYYGIGPTVLIVLEVLLSLFLSLVLNTKLSRMSMNGAYLIPILQGASLVRYIPPFGSRTS